MKETQPLQDESAIADELAAILVEKEAISRGGRLSVFHWLVVGASLLLTLFVWNLASIQVERTAAARFERESDQVIQGIRERMRLYEDALWGGVAAIQSAGGDMSHAQWRVYADSLNIDQKYPGINGIGVIHHLQPDEVPAYLAEQRKTRSDFRIHPEHAETQYLPISYIEPEPLNKKAVGLDMAHERNRYQAALRARDRGQAQVTGPIVLVQDSEKTPEFLFFAPYYEGGVYADEATRIKNFVGIVYAPFTFKKLMKGTLDRSRRYLDIRISDDVVELYSEHESVDENFDQNADFVESKTISFYGRDWQFDLRSNLAFRNSIDTSQPTIILMGGILIDTMLLGVFILLARSNKRSINFAERISANYEAKARDLEDLVDRYAASNEELERFAYVASHDLQEPLRMVTNFTSLLERRYSAELNDEAKGYIKIARNSAKRMYDMVLDLLEYARVNEGDERVEHCSGDGVMKFVLSNLAEVIEHSSAVIEVDPLPEFRTNSVRLSRLLQNLVSNAIKYQPESNQPQIKISARDCGNGWEISVQDNGIGVDSEYSRKIFLPFSRLHDRETFAGTGMGLAICRKIVDGWGGRIWVEQRSDGLPGSVFRFTLPK